MSSTMMAEYVDIRPEEKASRLFARRSCAPALRTMREFAEQEVIIPYGPAGRHRRFSCDRQPFTRLWFDAVDSDRWTTFYTTGVVQSGKTLLSLIIPIMFYLFEYGERVILAGPTMEILADKWRLDLLPAITSSRYRRQLPASGTASKGGLRSTIEFRNGAVLRLMTGGARDKGRAAFTARILVITEVDGMDTAGMLSREADPITQLIARTAAFGDRARVFGECTPSYDTGRTWVEYLGGTMSRIALPCPRCGAFSVPAATADDRKALTGWEDAPDVIAARDRANYQCMVCAKPWSESQRAWANRHAVLIHRGQCISAIKPKGHRRTPRYRIKGVAPRTETLGFRWSAINNMFLSAGEMGRYEYLAAHKINQDAAERELLQFRWALPYRPPVMELAPLEYEALVRRVNRLAHGVLPDECVALTGGVDLHKYNLHYLIIAWRKDGSGCVVDYGVVPFDTDSMGVERATRIGLESLRDRCLAGWSCGNAPARVPDLMLIDVGWEETKDIAYQFCKANESFWMPCLGRGERQRMTRRYTKPARRTNVVRAIGLEYHISWFRHPNNIRVMEINSDFWKSYVHERLRASFDAEGALTFYNAPPSEHRNLVYQLTAERKVEEFVPGIGTVIVWRRERRQNHFFDCAYYATVAGYHVGVRLSVSEATAQPDRPPDSVATGKRPERVAGEVRPFRDRLIDRGQAWMAARR